jgi:quercetin dioxygenase-like cupin family protein
MSLAASVYSMTPELPQFVFQKNEGESFWVLGELYTFKLTSAETGGSLAVIETLTFPQNGPPPHTHTNEDETFYILEGRFSFTIGERTFEAGPNTLIRAPRGTPHAYKNISALPARKLIMISPAGFEDFFREIGEPAKDFSSPPPHRPGVIPRTMQIALKYGLRFQLPEGFEPN